MNKAIYKILVCNDDTSLLRMTDWSLKDRGYAVTTMQQERDATAALHRDHFDVVLTDMMARKAASMASLRRTLPEVMQVIDAMIRRVPTTSCRQAMLNTRAMDRRTTTGNWMHIGQSAALPLIFQVFQHTITRRWP